MATYSINDYYVYNKATGELEPYPQVAAQPGFNVIMKFFSTLLEINMLALSYRLR